MVVYIYIPELELFTPITRKSQNDAAPVPCWYLTDMLTSAKLFGLVDCPWTLKKGIQTI